MRSRSSGGVGTAGEGRGELRFTYDDGGAAVKFSGTVRGHEITGVLSTGTAARTAVGRLREPRPAAPAEMPADCRRYYDR